MIRPGIQRGYKTSAPMSQSRPMAQPTQQYGLSGAENALAAGARGGLNHLNQAGIDVNSILSGGYQGAQQDLQPYTSAGGQASNLQAQLSGALGAPAQQQALSNYQTSPFYDETRAQAERAITQNAAAGGNLASGNTLDQLYQNASGMFLDDFNNRMEQLGGISQRGYGAARDVAGIGADLSSRGAAIRSDLGHRAANVPLNAGYKAADYRSQAGRDIAQASADTTSSLATLMNQQGAGISDMTGDFTSNIQSLIEAATQGDANSKYKLATILSNLSSGSATQNTNIPFTNIQTTNTLGQVGQLASGIGGMLGQFKKPSTDNLTPDQTIRAMGSNSYGGSGYNPGISNNDGSSYNYPRSMA